MDDPELERKLAADPELERRWAAFKVRAAEIEADPVLRAEIEATIAAVEAEFAANPGLIEETTRMIEEQERQYAVMDKLALLLAGHLYDRGSDVRLWPADEQALHRADHWRSYDERAAAVRRLRFEKAAKAVIAAGWQPPDRVIYTVEELEALPAESFVQVISAAEDPEEPQAIVWLKELDDEWVESGSAIRHPATAVGLPAWLRWSPPLRPAAPKIEGI